MAEPKWSICQWWITQEHVIHSTDQGGMWKFRDKEGEFKKKISSFDFSTGTSINQLQDT